MVDILIIGGGPAGLTAALYAARAGKSVMVCEREALGGQITQAHEVRNYPAISAISGLELGDRMCAQAMEAGAEIEFCAVTSLSKNADGTFLIQTEDGDVTARAVIYAGGAKPRPLGLSREEELVGNGVSYCALCDGDFFRGQDVAVVGGGNTALGDALYLAGICRSVALIHRREAFRGEEALVRAAREKENLRILTPAIVTALQGEDELTGITLRYIGGGEEELAVSAVFVAYGRQADAALLSALLGVNGEEYLAVGEDCATSVPGLFVAGDCRAKEVRQLTTAVSDGTVAATNACHYLDRG